MSIRNQDVISWSSLRDDTASPSRIGFMSQVSPDGRYVLTMLPGTDKGQLAKSYYAREFQGLPFPPGVLSRRAASWRGTTARRAEEQPLPGADDPRYVQTNAVWSPDGKYVVFARAEARDPYPEARKCRTHANDPEETQIQYDLYRIPFNDGKGGQPVPIAGASHNGMSNSFPKVSPDGRWIVFVKCRNAQLMRPDSQLYIVPAEGGVARRMRCNTPLDEFLAQLLAQRPLAGFLLEEPFALHADVSDAPRCRGQRQPGDPDRQFHRGQSRGEYSGVCEYPPDGMMKIDVPAAESYRLFDTASDLAAKGQIEEAIVEWRRVLEMDPRNASAHSNLGAALMTKGNTAEGRRELQEAHEIDPLTPDPEEVEITFELQLYYRQQFNAAIASANCKEVAAYGQKLLASSPDSEVDRAMKECATQPVRVQR